MTMLDFVMTNLRLVISKYSLSDNLHLDSIGAKLGSDDVVFRHDVQDLRHIEAVKMTFGHKTEIC